MILDIEKLKIGIKTNIPGKSEIVFTNKLLYNPDKSNRASYSEYPFITDSVKYPKDKLILLSYNEILDFFFIEDKFSALLDQYVNKNGILNDEDKKENLEYNISVMLNLLFPTSFPVTNNYVNSYDTYILKNSVKLSIDSLFSKKKYSYINIDGKLYTVTRFVWLNDILNHPIYARIINSFMKYKKWADKEKIKNENNMKLIEKNIQTILNNNNLNSLQTEFENIKNENESINQSNNYYYRDNKKQKELQYSLQKSINELNKLNNAQNTETIEILTLVLKLYNEKIKGNITFSKENRILIDKIEKLVNNYNSLDTFNSKYLDNYNIDISDKNMNNNKISQFIKEFKEILGPIRESNNNNLQKILNNYGNNLTEPDVKIFQELMKEITKFIYDSNKNGIEDDDLNIYYIGINNTNADDDTKPQNEIYIHLDLIDGEINDANVSNIKCMYQDLKLTKQFLNMVEPTHSKYWMNVSEPFLVLNKSDNSVSSPNVENKEPPVGGRKTKRKHRNLRKTRRTKK